MKIINPNDTVEFQDEDGDILVCLRAPRNRAFGLRDELVLEETAKIASIFKDFDLDKVDKKQVEEARENLQKTTEEIKTLAIREFMFKAVAVKLIIGGQTVEGDEKLIEAYRNADPKSAKWIDDCIEEVWRRGEPPEDKKK